MATSTSDPKLVGKWEAPFKLENVAVHAHLLHTGKVLYWGRRANLNNNNMDQQLTNAFLLDPSTGKSTATKARPKLPSKIDVNLFCSGHCFLPDGKLFIAGGHLQDFNGVNQACVYDPVNDEWTPKPAMNNGRWYPSTLMLSDGSVLCISGCFKVNVGDSNGTNNNVPQLWRNETWLPVTTETDAVFALYPQLHLDPKGRVFVAGPKAQSQFLDLNAANTTGTWTTDGPPRQAAYRDYGPSVMYDQGKIMYVGGGDPPTEVTEFINLNATNPKWKANAEWISSTSTNMHIRRRQHNATVLPDGTVLVTGGTRGSGFNNIDVGMPVHQAELFNPTTMTWTMMAEESTDRCYHGVALLLPDGQVLSAGGGEGDNAPPHTDAQLFKPPYLFNGSRPTISNVSSPIDYSKTFDVTIGAGDSIKTVSWARLASVTHSTNMSQSFMFLNSTQQGTKVTVKAPASPNVAPPGYYMLFLLNQQGVPAVAPIVHIGSASTAAPTMATAAASQPTGRTKHMESSLPALNEKIIAEQATPAVVVGITSNCPYGLSPCWGGAYDALQRMDDIAVVRPIPDQTHSLAFVHTHQDILPDIDQWRSEFEKTANQSYQMRGIEMTLTGAVTKTHVGADEKLTMAGTSTRPKVALTPFKASSSIRWDVEKKATRPVSESEAGAFARLTTLLADYPAGVTVKATGTLQKHGGNRFSLDVRDFEVVDSGTATS